MNHSFEVAAFNLFAAVVARPDLDLHGICYCARLCENKRTVAVELVFRDDTELSASFELPYGVPFDRDGIEQRLLQRLSADTVH